MENKSRTSKFVSRQTTKTIEQAKKIRIILIIGAIAGVIAMAITAGVVYNRANPKDDVIAAAFTSGTYGDFEYERNGGGVTITAYNGNSSEAVLPGTIDDVPVQQIGSGAFENNAELISITMPDSVVSIGANAFKGCTALINVDMSQSLYSIGDNAFAGCKMLKSINLPASFMGGAANAFEGCHEEFALTVIEGGNGQTYAETNNIAFKLAGEDTAE